MFVQVEVPSKLQRGVQQRCGELRRPTPSQDLLGSRPILLQSGHRPQDFRKKRLAMVAILKMEGI